MSEVSDGLARNGVISVMFTVSCWLWTRYRADDPVHHLQTGLEFGTSD